MADEQNHLAAIITKTGNTKQTGKLLLDMIGRMSLKGRCTVARRCYVAASHQMRWRSAVVIASSQNAALATRTKMPMAVFHPHASSFYHCRYFSSATGEDHANIDEDRQESICINKPIRILFGSQGGTAQIFSMQLADALDEHFPNRPVVTMGLQEASSNISETLDPNAINIILMSVAGVGEPPDNARAFYEWLMSNDDDDALHSQEAFKSVEYTIFGLGNQKAHPNHFNVIAKNVDARLQELGATRIHDMGLGDDGECIEDDFDVWLDQFLHTLSTQASESRESTIETPAEVEEQETIWKKEESQELPSSKRVVSTKYPELILEPATTTVAREDLFHLQATARPFYQSDFEKMSVKGNKLLNVRSAEYGLREMNVNLPGDTTYYETGDHFVVYPKNSYCLVEAYVELLGVDPHVVIQEPSDRGNKPYPHPTGITLFETLLHCVDLGAVPSPAFSRELLGRKDIDYKNDVAYPRRTVLDLALESGRQFSLEDINYNLTPMQPRYYSIASSPLVHPTQVYLTYRPVKYVSTRGAIREGTCTAYMVNLAEASELVGAVRSNPSFRLPQDPASPVLLMAGGCGIAAIRAFLEERLAQAADSYDFGEGPHILYLGFRSPCDEVYRDVVDEALAKGVLTSVQVSYTSGCVEPDQHCRLVSETVRANGKQVWDLFESGGYTYLCGGARTFGAAVEREVIAIIQEQGNMNEEGAIAYLRQLIKEGRFCEDLAD